ncbi:hypothetical protein PGB34_08705 [Xenophilus arseniciresistens]|uniref:Uncharacterized protein n=1 Tax=Xenophilus arseniciresistens TaxID=1283306 RepID=A0AAE3N5T8_9BURK|nr:hypothetical protein [Xenophilus arseniciresistens]MDA7416445.1 hypothetical protein [Xenophilus arseniciresistens]
MNSTECTRKFLLTLATVSAFGIAACGSRGPVAEQAADPEPQANSRNAVVVPPIAYGKTDKGQQLSAADDACGVPASLRQAIEDHLTAPYEFMVQAPSPQMAGAPTMRIEIADLLANAGGLYGGPKLIELRGTLERPDAAPARFTARRQMFIYFGLPRSTCSMVGKVSYALGADIAQWLHKPVDGARLGE